MMLRRNSQFGNAQEIFWSLNRNVKRNLFSTDGAVYSDRKKKFDCSNDLQTKSVLHVLKAKVQIRFRCTHHLRQTVHNGYH